MIVHSPKSRKASACGARGGQSIIQATQAIGGQQLNSIPTCSPQILEHGVNNYHKSLFLEPQNSALDNTDIREDILNKIYGLID